MSGKLKPIWILALVLLAVSCGRHSDREMTDQQLAAKVKDGAERFAQKYELDDKQTSVVVSESDKLTPQLNEVRKIRKPLRSAAIAEISKTKPDAKALRSLLTNADTTTRPFVHEVLDSALAIHATLTPEQRAEMLAEWKDRKNRKGKHAWVVDAVTKRFLDEIEATDDQYAFALEKKDEMMAKAGTLMNQLGDSRTFFKEEFAKDTPDGKALHGQIDASATRMLAFGHGATDAVAEFAGSLSEQQRVKVRELIAENR